GARALRRARAFAGPGGPPLAGSPDPDVAAGGGRLPSESPDRSTDRRERLRDRGAGGGGYSPPPPPRLPVSGERETLSSRWARVLRRRGDVTAGRSSIDRCRTLRLTCDARALGLTSQRVGGPYHGERSQGGMGERLVGECRIHLGALTRDALNDRARG